MKTQKIAILTGAYFNGISEVLNSMKIEYKIILHKNNPETVNAAFSKSNSNNSIELINSNLALLEVLNLFSPSVIISLGWRFILKETFFNAFKNTYLINIHPAILPDYKGYHTEPYIIMNNEKRHGITAHILTEELDAGDIILQEIFNIGEFSTVKSIKYEVNNIMPKFFQKLLDILSHGDIKTSPQVGKTKVVAPKRKPEDSQLNQIETIDKLYNKIRACDPELYPAFFFHNNEKIYLKVWTNRNSKKNPFEI